MDSQMNEEEATDLQGLSRLIDILLTMEPDRARDLLRNTALKLQASDPEKYLTMMQRIQNPERVLKQLGRGEARKVWGALSPQVRNALADGMDQEKTLDFLDLPRPKDDRMVGHEEAVAEFYSVLKALRDKGSVRWEKLWESILEAAPCTTLASVDPWVSGNLVLLDPLVTLGSSARVFAVRAARDQETCHFSMTFQVRDVERKIAEAKLAYGEDGMAFWRTPPLGNPGLYTLQAKTPDGVLMAHRTVAVARNAEHHLPLRTDHLRWQGKGVGRTLHVTGSFVSVPKAFEDREIRVRVELICGCSHVVDAFGWTVSGKAAFKVALKSHGHHGPFYLQYTETGLGLRHLVFVPAHADTLDPAYGGAGPKDLPVQVIAHKGSMRNGHLQVRFSTPRAGILVATRAWEALPWLDAQLLTASEPPQVSAEGYHVMNARILEAEHPFAMDVTESPLLTVVRISGTDTGERELDLAGPDPVLGIRVHFYHRRSNGTWTVARSEARENSGPILTNLPSVVQPKDRLSGWILPRTGAVDQLLVEMDGTAGESKNLPLSQNKTTLVHVTGGDLPRVSAGKGGEDAPLWSHDWRGSPSFDAKQVLSDAEKEGAVNLHFRWMQAGETLKLTHPSAVIFPNLRSWIGYAAEQMIVDYPCRCAEQTSAMISGLWILQTLIRSGYRPMILSENQVGSLLQHEMNRLISFQHDDGRLAFWPITSVTEYEQEVMYAAEEGRLNDGEPSEWRTLKTIQDKSLMGRMKRFFGMRAHRFETVKEALDPAQAVRDAAYEARVTAFYDVPELPYPESFTTLLEEIVWQNLAPVRQQAPKPLVAFLDQLHPHVKRFLSRPNLFETKLEILIHKSQKEGLADGLGEEIAKLVARAVHPKEDAWLVQDVGMFRDSAYFNGLVLDYCGDHPEGLVTGKLANVANPEAALINGLAQSEIFGYWGTSGTIRALRGLLKIDQARRLNATYQVDGVALPNVQEPVVITGRSITALDGEGLVAMRSLRNPMDCFEVQESRRKPVGCRVKLGWAMTTSPLEKGGVFLLEVRMEGEGITSPMAFVSISGLLRLEDQLEEVMMLHPGVVRMALPSRFARLAFRAVREGSGTLRVLVRNMYDAEETVEETLNFSVR